MLKPKLTWKYWWWLSWKIQSGCQGCHHCAYSGGKLAFQWSGWSGLVNGYLESNAGVVNDAVKIDIEQHETVHSWGMERVRL